MSAKKLSRRDLLKLIGTTTAAGAVLAACSGAVPPAAAPTTAPETKAEPKQEEPAATAAPSGPVKVVLMYNANEISDPEIADFNKKYAPITVERIDTDLVKFFSMVAAGTQVDGIRLYGVNTPAYVTKKVALDLTDYFNSSQVLKVDDLFPVNDMWVFKGKRYGMVKDWSPDVSIWINKKVWGEMGVTVPDDPMKKITYEEWRLMSPKLTKKEGDQVIIWGTDFTPHTNPLFWATTTFEPPRTMFNSDFSKLVLKDDPDTYEAIKFWTDWELEKGVPSAIAPASTQGGWSGTDWQAGQAAAVQWGYWFGGMAESEKVSGDDIMMMRAPQWGPNYSNPTVSGCGMFINSKTPNKDAAWKMFEWFMGEEPAQNRAKSGWGVPGQKSLLSLMPQDKPWRKQVYDMVQWELQNSKVPVMTFSPYTYPDAFAATWSKYHDQYLKGAMGFDDFIINIEKEVNASIQEGMDAAGE
jgi:multiple sugar transport system substrate-binding protein